MKPDSSREALLLLVRTIMVGPRTQAELAKSCPMHRNTIRQALRILVRLGLVHETETKTKTGQTAKLYHWSANDRDEALLRQALEALEYHREQTRPIERTAQAIAALLKRLDPARKG